MIIDGSFGEGGGQILRTAIALSAVTGEPVEINNIRKNRPKPGLSAQHVKAVESAAALCGGEVSGCAIRSTEMVFKPGKIKSGAFNIDIGTAGSITLLLQCLMPAAMHSPGDVKLTISGGTDVPWSPTIDYLRRVTMGALFRMGYKCDIRIIRRGYYPRGEGCVGAVIHPAYPAKTEFETNECAAIQGISHSSRLPSHVTQRQAAAASDLLKREGYESGILLETGDYPSTGSGLTLWCGTAGGSALGRPGLRAEKVGSIAAEALLEQIRHGAAVDVFLADQLIPYMALAGGGSFTTGSISSHTRTNIWVTEQFTDVKFNIEKNRNGSFRVRV